jgi:hypothetical protein
MRRQAPPVGSWRRGLLLGAGLLLLALLGSLAWQAVAPAPRVASQLASARPWLALWRAVLFIGLIGAWPRLCARWAVRCGWSAARRDALAAARWRVAGWLMVLEALLVQDLPRTFLAGVLS